MFLITGLGNPGPEYTDTRHNLGFAVIDLLAQSWGTNLKSDAKLHGFVGKDIAHEAILLMPTTYMNNSGQAVKATLEYYNIDFLAERSAEKSKSLNAAKPSISRHPELDSGSPSRSASKSEVSTTQILNQVQDDRDSTGIGMLAAPNSLLITRYSPLILIHDDLDIPLGNLKIQPGGGGHGGHNGVRSVIQHLNSPDFIRFRLGIGRPPHPQIAPADWVLQKPSGHEAEVLASLVNTAAHAIESLLTSGLEPTMNQYNHSKLLMS